MRALPWIGAMVVAGCASSPRPIATPAAPPPRIPLAITIDDLPFIGPLAPNETRLEAIDRIAAAGRAHGAPLRGFATCHRIADERDLVRWHEHGVLLENHSDAHRAIDELGLEAWRADLERCQARIETTTGRAPSFFRYPFLRTGADRELRDASFAALDELELRRAPVTIDTSDWMLARSYAAAVRAGDAERADEIATAYLEHVRAAARRYASRAESLGHPGAPHVLLLHANLLAADRLDALLAMLEHEGFRFVTLEDALADPLYAREDHYVGGVGLSWLYRVEPGAHDAWAWDAAQLHALSVRFAGERERDAFDLDDDLSIRRIARDTWIVVHEEPWPANTLLARMDDGRVLLVSTPYTDGATVALLDWIRARFGAAPIVAINPHFHPDGVGGNRALSAAGARTIGSDLTARLVMEHRGAIRDQLVTALADRPELAARFAAYDPLPPAERFPLEQGLRITFGREEVHILHPGAAHSADNVVVHFVHRDLVYGGCMIAARDNIGNVQDADLDAWPDAIARVRALGASILVPGHGDRREPALLDHTLTLLGETR
jgi:peptidoglycan/xylan/chitin deacetylase (PgdA/CDA1 family)/glyoxylase-like metal-dependent hydrolase (beta-lactamase superfamily II)